MRRTAPRARGAHMRGKWLIATAIAAMLLGGLGTAGAAKLISGKDVRDRSIRGRDIAKNSVYSSNLSEGLRKTIFQQQASSTSPGGTGQQGTKGAKGDTGAAGPQGAKGDTGAQGQQGSAGSEAPPGAATPVTPFENFKSGTDTPEAVWADDQFDCGSGNTAGTGTQGFENGNSEFANQDPPLQSGYYLFNNSGNNSVDTEFVVHNNAFEGQKLSDLQAFRYSEIWSSTGPGTHEAPRVEIRVDPDPHDDTDQPIRLQFVPANANGAGGSPQQGAEREGVWQSWNLTLPDVRFGQNGDPGDGYTTLAQFLDAHPDAVLQASGFEGAIRILVGCGANSQNIKGGVDN